MHGRDMVARGGIGFVTTLLELAASSISFGIVVISFLASCLGMVSGWTRRDWEAQALRIAFGGGVAGIFCLCLDLIVRYLGWP